MAVKADDKFLFTAPVMIPDKPDCDYNRGEDPFTAEEIQFFKDSFDDYQLIDKNHQVFYDIGSAKSIGDPVDSFILKEDTTYQLANGDTETYPKGTWMLTTNVTDPTSQKEINAGLLTGYSPSVHREEIGKLIKKMMATKSSQGQLIHDIENPATITVSIVRQPCQSGSKECKLKTGSVKMGNDKKTLDKIRELLNGNPDYATKSDFDALAEELRESNEAALKSMTESMSEVIANNIGDSVKEALAPLGALKGKNDDDDDDTGDGDETDPTPTKSNGDGEGTTDPEDNNDDDNKNKKKNDGSKQGKIHNGATKSNNDDDLDTYAFLGRKPDGTVKRTQ